MANTINKTSLKLSIWNIQRRLNALLELPEEVLERIPEQKFKEITSEIESFKKQCLGIESEISQAKTWHRLAKTLNANA